MNGVKHRDSSPGLVMSVAYMQAIGIILVVLGHSFHLYPDGHHGSSMWFYRMIYSFHMPLFMFVSGFLMVFTTRLRGNGVRLSSRRFIIGKVKRLLIPFFVLGSVTFFPRALMSSVADDTIELSVRSFVMSLFHTDHLTIPYFWFIQASFLILCGSYLLMRLFERLGVTDRVKYPLILLIFFILGWLPIEYTGFFSVRRAVFFSVYFAFGMLYARFGTRIDRSALWDSPLPGAFFTALWGILFFITENSDWQILCSLAGIGMCMALAKLLVHYDAHWLDHLVGANYIIFLLSWYCNVAAQQVLAHFVPGVPWWICTLLSLVSGLYIPWIGYRYLQTHRRSRWVKVASFLLGQSLRER
ncbi:MAG: acyltransferase [Bacteroides sp.]|nr:acyltransferase [Bacteroides sp.]